METQVTSHIQTPPMTTSTTLLEQCAHSQSNWEDTVTAVPLKPFNWFLNRLCKRFSVLNSSDGTLDLKLSNLLNFYSNGQNLELREILNKRIPFSGLLAKERIQLILLQSLNETQLGTASYRISEEDIPKVHLGCPRNELRVCFQMCLQNARYYLFEKKDPTQVRSWVNQMYHQLGIIGIWDSEFFRSAQILTWYIVTSSPTNEFSVSNELAQSIETSEVSTGTQLASPADLLNLSLVYSNLARYYLNKNDFESSLKFCDFAVKLDPSNGILRLLRAIIFLKTGDLKKFEDETSLALRLHVFDKQEIQATLCLEDTHKMIMELERILGPYLEKTSCHNLNSKQNFEVSKPMKNFLTLESPKIHQVTVLEYAPQVNFKAFTEAHAIPFEYETTFLMSHINRTDRTSIVNTNTPWPPGDSLEYFSKQNENTQLIFESFQSRSKLNPQQKAFLGVLLRTLGFETEANEVIGVTDSDCLENMSLFAKPQSTEIFLDFVKLSIVSERQRETPQISTGSKFLDSTFQNIKQRYAQKNIRSLKSLILSAIELLKIGFRAHLHSKSNEINSFLTEAIIEAGQSKKFNAFELSMMKLKHEFAFSHSTQLRSVTKLELLKETERSIRLLETSDSIQFLSKKELLLDVMLSEYYSLLEMGRLSQATMTLEEICNLESVKNEYHYQLGLVYLTSGNTEEAKKVFLSNLNGLASIKQRSLLALSEIFEIEKDQFRSSSLAI
jgi:tetratricopeptide (TPR) repeat protein